jgi:hypothetical protein
VDEVQRPDGIDVLPFADFAAELAAGALWP